MIASLSLLHRSVLLRGAERFKVMRKKLLAAALGFLVFSIAASMSIANSYRGCTTDSECVAQCERAGGTDCDDVLGGSNE